MRFPSTAQIAQAVWNMVAIASRTVTVTTNNDKTGYTLTAASYVVRASSSQHGTKAVASPTTNDTQAVSSVTTTRAHLATSAPTVSSGDLGSTTPYAYLSGSTAISFARFAEGGVTATTGYSLQELL